MDDSRKAHLAPGLRVRLSAMMFMQFMVLPVWFNTVIPYMKTLPGGENWLMWCGMLMGFGTLASPVMGMFADRFLNAEKVLAICNLAYALLMVGCFLSRSPALLFLLLLASSVVIMPGWSLTATIAMANSSSAAFPGIRVFGTLGWAASAVFSVVAIRCLGIADFDKSPYVFAASGAAALVMAAVALLQPPTPPAARGQPMSVASALGLKAFTLFRDRGFASFVGILVLSMLSFQWYMGYNAFYLDESGFRYLALTQNLGQVGELGFMLVVPWLVKRFGYRRAMVIGLSALALRYALFYASVATGCHLFDFGGIFLHGLIFSLLIVGAQMYVDDHAPAALRNQAQGMIMTMTTSVGAFLSVTLFDRILVSNALPSGLHDWSVPFLVAFAIALTAALAMAFRKD